MIVGNQNLLLSQAAANPGCRPSGAEQPNLTARDKLLTRLKVRLMTIHATKGLEFLAAIVSALDELPNPTDQDEVSDRNLLYVGLTRATDLLVVTRTGRSASTDRVLRAKKVAAHVDTGAPFARIFCAPQGYWSDAQIRVAFIVAEPAREDHVEGTGRRLKASRSVPAV